MFNNKQRLVLSLASNKLADLLISAKTTLPALLIFLGAPSWMVSWLVPIRESGALLPQAAIGVMLRKTRSRHRVWRSGIVIQIMSLASMLVAALLFTAFTAGAIILVALIILSLGRSACSLTIKDIEADIVEKGARGKLMGIASTASGMLTFLVALPLVYYQQSLGEVMVLSLLVAAMAAFSSALVFLLPIRTHVEKPPSECKQNKTRFWQFSSVVYRFILVRGLFVHSALVAPYFMLESEANAQKLLPFYLAAQASAAMLSSFIWGKIADKSARLTLQIAGVLALFSCGLLMLSGTQSVWFSGALFLMLSIAHMGVRTGRKTYSLDVREGQSRTELVAFSNTAIGLILLAFGGLYAAIESQLSFSVVYLMMVMLLLGLLMTLFLPNEK